MAGHEKLASAATPPGPLRGVISRLVCLSAGSDIQSARLVSAHNGAGYGYIHTPAGDVFFDASASANRRFDQLARNMTVEFALDQAPYLRTSRITVVAAETAGEHQ